MNILIAMLLLFADQKSSDPPKPLLLSEALQKEYWQIRAEGAEAIATQLQAKIAYDKASVEIKTAQSRIESWMKANCHPIEAPDKSLTCPAAEPAKSK